MSSVPDMLPKYWIFQKKANIVIFLSSGVARQHRKTCDDLIALLLYGFSNLRYYKHNISDVLVYRQYFQILDIIYIPYIPKKNEIFNKFRGHVELGWANQILLKLLPIIGTS